MHEVDGPVLGGKDTHPILSTHTEYYLSDFPYEKPDRHHLPDDCPASWEVWEPLRVSVLISKRVSPHTRVVTFATALREWEPLAEQGDAAVQFNLGILYRLGKGLPQDDKPMLT